MYVMTVTELGNCVSFAGLLLGEGEQGGVSHVSGAWKMVEGEGALADRKLTGLDHDIAPF